MSLNRFAHHYHFHSRLELRPMPNWHGMSLHARFMFGCVFGHVEGLKHVFMCMARFAERGGQSVI